MMDIELGLVKKYNVAGPRYTSYPTAVQFREAGIEARAGLEAYLADRNRTPRPISLYFHIPFCFSLCWYCGCTKVITKDRGKGDLYLDYLEREMDMLSSFLHPDSEVVQVHFGGGTPTFLSPSQLQRLGSALHKRFQLSADTEFSVEIDPRRCTRSHIQALCEIGCNRASLGVQDTDPDVQEAIHRVQPFELTERVTRWLRQEGIRAVNFDLIYGLPCQTPAGFEKTMNDVLQLTPDRIALYSYAHIPDVMPSQKLLNVDAMPSVDDKLGMLVHAIAHCTGNGYRFIGMDHFSRNDEELSHAMDNKTLQRNFQGYSTQGGADLYAVGMSGISNVGDFYWQNNKTLEKYYNALDHRRLPAARVLQLSRDDRIRKDAIMQIMCKMGLNGADMEQKWGISFFRYFKDALTELVELERDGLIKIYEGKEIKVTDQGRLFLRNIAMCFDRYLKRPGTPGTFSKTI